MSLGDHKLDFCEVAGEGYVLVPFGFTINTTTDPDGITGHCVATITRSEAGEFLCTLAAGYAPYSVVFGTASVSVVADDTDVTCLVDWSTTTADRIFTVRTMTGAVQTDPTDNLLVGGFLLCKKTDRLGYRG